MKHATYTGVDRMELRGKTALIRLRDVDTVYAQFDDVDAPDRLGKGWHRFPAEDWTLDDDTPESL